MSEIYVNNSGFTKTLFRNKKLKKNNSSEFSWNANYDGKIANISVDSNVNGTKSHKAVKLNNSDLEQMLSIPNVNGRLDERLMNDFHTFSNQRSKKHSIKKSIKPKTQRIKNKLKRNNKKMSKRNI